jgi:N-acetylmuramoyl-L-alanine amidase
MAFDLHFRTRRAAVIAGALIAALAAPALAGDAPPRHGGDWTLRAQSFDALDSGPAAVASDVHIAQAGDRTRLVFDLSSPVDARAFVLADPRRVIIDLPEVSFLIDPNRGLPAPPEPPRARRPARKAPAPVSLGPLIRSFRFGLFAPGKSRIVVDLAEPARVVRAESEAAEAGTGARLVIDLAKTTPQAFAKAAAAGRALGAAQAAAPAPVVAAGDTTRPLVVVDPGHGGVDVGAQSGDGDLEKTIVFEFAKALCGRLTASDRYRVVMTRSEDIFVPLAERVRIAREAGAALFVSIHADTISSSIPVSGATVYTLSEKASDAEAERVARNENMADAAGGLEGKDDTSEVSDILFDLTRRETRAYSHLFAHTLIGYLKAAARLNKNPQRSAGFRVLKAPDVPSVLLELGYLSNDGDLSRLRSAEWREKAAASVARAIDSFFKDRIPAAAENAATRLSDAAVHRQSVAPAIH